MQQIKFFFCRCNHEHYAFVDFDVLECLLWKLLVYEFFFAGSCYIVVGILRNLRKVSRTKLLA